MPDAGERTVNTVPPSAARLAQHCIRKVEVLEYPELGLAAAWRTEIENFPAVMAMNDKEDGFYEGLERVPRRSYHGVLARITSAV